jgi:acyl carrier protein
VDEIDPDENIFDLGFDSFSTIQVVQKVEATLNKRISLKQIYDFDTIRDIAKFLEKQDVCTATQEDSTNTTINKPTHGLDDLFSNV